MRQSEMPVGFSMALMQNPEAMKKFALLSEEQKQVIAEGAHSVNSRNEMRRYVEEMLQDV